MKIKRIYSSVLLAVLGLSLFTGCKRTPDQKAYESQLLYFDTVISLSFYSDKDGDAMMANCTKMIQDFENTFSRTKEGSVLYNLNHRTENIVEVPDDVALLISTGLDYYNVSGGKFDITVAPLSDLWDFKSEDATVPDDAAIKAVLPSVDASAVSIDGNTVTFASDDTMIDLGALVKGYAADKVKEYLVSEGVTSGLLNFGGNVLTIGAKPDNSNWKIGIQKPFSSHNEVADVAEVKDKTVVTSGIYERYFIQDNVIYHHILDPDTGYPVQGDIYGVTIITDSSLTGDALSTTCLLLNYEKARELIDSLDGVEAIFILDSGKIRKTF